MLLNRLSDAPRNPAQRPVPVAYAATAARAQQSTTPDIARCPFHPLRRPP